MNLRTSLQNQIADIFINENKNGILHLCPRFGKCAVGINIINKLECSNVLIVYPDNTIIQSWKNEFKRLKFDDSKVQLTTALSMKKYLSKDYDLIIVDEIHTLSTNQIEILRKFKNKKVRILGLSGTISQKTKDKLNYNLSLGIIYEYLLNQAIKDKIIPDYTITIKKIKLNDSIPIKYNNKIKTEKRAFDDYSYVIEKLKKEGKETKFLRLKRMDLIKKSIAKRKETIDLIKRFNSERILVFCGLIEIAESLSIPSFHSKSKDDSEFLEFAEGEGNHLAVVKIGGTGVTYKPLNKVLINFFDSNPETLAQNIFRCMSMEYNNPDKKSDIWIISTDESVETEWLKNALEFFDKSKIKYITL